MSPRGEQPAAIYHYPHTPPPQTHDKNSELEVNILPTVTKCDHVEVSSLSTLAAYL